jgi:hypothetical protein
MAVGIDRTIQYFSLRPLTLKSCDNFVFFFLKNSAKSFFPFFYATSSFF